MIIWPAKSFPGTFDFAVERLSRYGGKLPWYPSLFHKFHYGKCIDQIKGEFSAAGDAKQETSIASFLKSKYFAMLYEDLSEAIPGDKVREVAAKIGSDDPQIKANLGWLEENYAPVSEEEEGEETPEEAEESKKEG